MIGPSWFSCCVGQFKTAVGQFVMPGHVKGTPMPGFLGGSDLAVPASSSNKDLAADWIKDFTSTTSEKALHLSALRRYPELNATMHCHAKHCTMFALTRQPIPAVIEEFVVYVGGEVPVANYETTGTDELAEEVAGWVGDRSAVLMANHGLFAVGKNPADVLHVAGLVERTAEIVWGAQRLGEIVPLPEATNTQFAGYYRYGRTGKF